MANLYRLVTLSEWCATRGTSYVQRARHRRAERRLRPIPGYNDNTYAFAHIDNPDIFYGHITGARIIPGSGFVCTPDGCLIRRQLTQSDEIPTPAKRYILGKDPQGQYLISLPEPSGSIDQSCVFVGGEANFGHMIIESMMRLMVLAQAPEIRSLPIVVYDDLPARFYELFDLVGYSSERRIEVSRGNPPMLTSAWLVSAPMYRASTEVAPQLWPDGVWALRAHAAHLFRPFNGPRPRLFLPRGAAAWRRLVNETSEALRSALRRFGVVAAELRDHTVAQQIAEVSNAELIVTVQGAGGQITTFAPADCAIVELAAPDLGAALGPQGTALILDQPYVRIRGQRVDPAEVAAAGLAPNPSSHDKDRDFSIDVDELSTVLQAAAAYCSR